MVIINIVELILLLFVLISVIRISFVLSKIVFLSTSI